MSFKLAGVRVNIAVLLFCYLAFAIALNSSRAVMLALAFMLCHEAGHCLALCACGVKLREISLGVGRFCIVSDMDENSPGTVFVLFAGPLVNLLLFLLFRLLGRQEAATINFALACFNLLPCGQLDGGRLFAILAQRVFSKRAEMLITSVNILVSSVVVCLCVTSVWVAKTPNLIVLAAFCGISIVFER